jgi:hypothetical protein
MQEEKPVLGIRFVANVLIWLETMLITVSSALLLFVAVLTVASSLNGGRLLADGGALSQWYAWCQGLGIEGQLSGMAFAAARQARLKNGKASFLYWCLTLLLGFISFGAIGVSNYAQTFNVSFSAALAATDISPFLWVWVRAFILVLLLVLAAAMRYQSPVVDNRTADQKIAEIEENSRIAAAKAKARADGVQNGLGGLIGGVRGALASHAGSDGMAVDAPLE